ncbi:hypothetical protein NDN08_004330 [Rhodosorus marinus]|uniref:RING-type E3 ubiquitin transferase BRCA1 n=1 Tax=Rhodosorus marinus TaxID=101924 RepID=A0AAV8UL04_9RHOD|nr:hypothetical protein NDN08_004330 [Rhodosorus marinus]
METILSNVEEQLKTVRSTLRCYLCGEILANPYRIDSCNHSFCFECVKPAVEESDKCPACQLPAYPRDLIQNKHLRNLLVGFLRLESEVRVVVGRARSRPSEPAKSGDQKLEGPEGSDTTKGIEKDGGNECKRSSAKSKPSEQAKSGGRKLSQEPENFDATEGIAKDGGNECKRSSARSRPSEPATNGDRKLSHGPESFDTSDTEGIVNECKRSPRPANLASELLDAGKDACLREQEVACGRKELSGDKGNAVSNIELDGRLLVTKPEKTGEEDEIVEMSSVVDEDEQVFRRPAKRRIVSSDEDIADGCSDADSVSDFPSLSVILGVDGTTERKDMLPRKQPAIASSHSSDEIDSKNSIRLISVPISWLRPTEKPSCRSSELAACPGVAIAFTNIRDHKEMELMKRMCHYMGAEVVESVESMKQVTHVISGVNKRGAARYRSIRIMLALAGSKFIVREEWLADSVKEGRWLDEEKFTPVGFDIKRRRSLPPVFNSTSFALVGDFPNPEPERLHLEMLIEFAGGKLTPPKPSEESDTILILDEKNYASKKLLRILPSRTIATSDTILDILLTGEQKWTT